MVERLHRVELTASFLQRLEAIEVFLSDAGAAYAYDDLVADLLGTVVPNLARFQRMGRRYLDQPPQSAEALAQLSQFPKGSASSLRVYLHGDYLVHYTVIDEVVYLLSIRHHRQLSFDFAGLWPS